MPDRFKYAKVRQEIINALRTDLMGPQSDDEVLDENPRSAYIVGMLASQAVDKGTATAGEQEVDADIAYGDSDDCILSSNNPWFCQSKFLGIATEIPW